MSGVFVKKLAEDIGKHLDGYRELVAKRAKIEARLQKAEREKDSVKESIFKRVTGEYTAEIEKLEGAIGPLREKVDKIRNDLNEGRGDLDSRIKKTEEEIEELSFRQRVGEYDESEFADRQQPLRSRIEELIEQAEEVKKLLAKIDEAENSTPAVKSAPALAKMADPESDSVADDDRSEDDDKTEPALQREAKSTPKAKAKKQEAKAEISEDIEDKPAPRAAVDAEPDRASPQPVKVDAKDSEESEPAKPAAKSPEPEVAASAKRETPSKASAPSGPPSEKEKPSADVVDTSGWAEELQRDLERTVHIRGRRATDEPTERAEVPEELDADDDEVATKVEPRRKPGAAGAAFPNLIITKGPGAGKKLPLIPVTMTLGREHDNNIELKDKDVSRYHARIVFSSGEYRIHDLDSSSGTFVNGESITEKQLSHGDKITVGSTELLIDFD